MVRIDSNFELPSTGTAGLSTTLNTQKPEIIFFKCLNKTERFLITHTSCLREGGSGQKSKQSSFLQIRQVKSTKRKKQLGREITEKVLLLFLCNYPALIFFDNCLTNSPCFSQTSLCSLTSFVFLITSSSGVP